MAIGDLKARLRSKFSRRYSTASSVSSADGADPPDQQQQGKKSKTTRSLRSRGSQRPPSTIGTLAGTIDEKEADNRELGAVDVVGTIGKGGQTGNLNACGSDLQKSEKVALEITSDEQHHKYDSTSTADFPTPNTDIPPVPEEYEGDGESGTDVPSGILFSTPQFDSPASGATPLQRPSELSRRQSLLPHQQTRLIKTLLETDIAPQSHAAADYFAHNGPATISANMVSRKIWVKRPGASATLVTIHEDDLVDDVRDMILKKYANSLGRSFDAPDVTLRIVPRDSQERTLGPEEPMTRTLDAYFPGGQTVAEALVIDVPLRRTPKPSPRPHASYYEEERRPAEGGSDYFPPMPVPSMPSPHLPNAVPHVNGQHPPLASHSMSVLTTGHVPNLPSPGSVRRHHRERPRVGRTHTSSPTVIAGQTQPQVGGTQHNGTYPNLTLLRNPIPRSPGASDKSIPSTGPPPSAPPLPTPPPQQTPSDMAAQIQRVATPPPRVSSPRPTNKPRKTKKSTANGGDHPSLPAGMLNGGVPPINVLIVEDNIINLKLLEAFMKRLKVRWQTAMNGREAVTKWRAGGFHLVLMDIQLPIMSGLEATKEIRRLERLNSIGVFSSSASSSAPSVEEEQGEALDGEDKLPSTVLFKSPVIIVALTASSLQSDRHEALAAGCNDFLTKVLPPSLSTNFPSLSYHILPNFLQLKLTPHSRSTSSGSSAK
jgi:osomolarity two-component system, response regulator SSK1